MRYRIPPNGSPNPRLDPDSAASAGPIPVPQYPRGPSFLPVVNPKTSKKARNAGNPVSQLLGPQHGVQIQRKLRLMQVLCDGLMCGDW